MRNSDGRQPTIYGHQYLQLKTGPAEMGMTANGCNTGGDLSRINVLLKCKQYPPIWVCGLLVQSQCAHGERTMSATPPMSVAHMFMFPHSYIVQDYNRPLSSLIYHGRCSKCTHTCTHIHSHLLSQPYSSTHIYTSTCVLWVHTLCVCCFRIESFNESK